MSRDLAWKARQGGSHGEVQLWRDRQGSVHVKNMSQLRAVPLPAASVARSSHAAKHWQQMESTAPNDHAGVHHHTDRIG